MSSTLVQQAIKQALKARRMTYQDLAAALGLTESGVKKMLSGPDLSLSRLFAICEILGLSATDLVQTAQNEAISEVQLNSRQEEALAADPQLLRVFWRIAIEEDPRELVAQKEGLPQNSLRKILIALEKLGLLRRTPKDDFVPVHRGLYRWAESGPLVQRLNRDWSELTLRRALSAKGQALNLHRLSFLFLTTESLQEFQRRMNDLIDETVRRSRREKVTHSRTKLTPVSLVVACTPNGFIDQVKLGDKGASPT